MKLISLNIFGGKWFEPLMAFLEEQRDTVDIFCFQEVFHTDTDQTDASWGARADIFNRIAERLPDFQAYIAPRENGFIYKGKADFDVSFGLAMFVKQGISISGHGQTFVYEDRINPAKYGGLVSALEYAVLGETSQISVANFHGLWIPESNKLDTEHRLAQSQNIRKFLDAVPLPKILCGDFNLRPDTKSLALLEEGMRNLVKEYGVTSTRSKFYDKECKYADYILVSPDVPVKDFRVIDVDVSDHLPLLVEFE